MWLLLADVEPRRLEQAIAKIVRPGYGEALVICVEGKLAYLETESEGGYLLVR